MARIGLVRVLVTAAIAVAVTSALALQARDASLADRVAPGSTWQAAKSGTTLGSVKLSQGVMANGQALAAGTYNVRVTTDSVTPVVGQSKEETAWVEFLQGTQVKGREIATVLAKPEAKGVVKGGSPAAGAARVQLLKGGDYLRVWVNHGGTQYLVHLSIAK